MIINTDSRKKEDYSLLPTDELVRRLKAAESLAKIQTAKLKNQVARFEKLESAYDMLNDEFQDQDEQFEKALAQEKRQKELVLAQMSELEEECLRLINEGQE